MWEHFFVFNFCFIEVLLHDEECLSERSPRFTTRPELDCTFSIFGLFNIYVFSFSDTSEMRSSKHLLLSYGNFVFC